MTGTRSVTAGLALAALLLAGCSGAPAGGPPAQAPPVGGGAAAPADASVRWTASVCDAITPAGTLGRKLSAINGTDTGSLTQVLDAATTALRASTTALDGVGASPIAGADAIVGNVKQTLGATAAGVSDARAKVAAGDESAAAGAFTGLATGLDTLTQITDAPGGSPLATAVAAAPSCRALTGG